MATLQPDPPQLANGSTSLSPFRFPTFTVLWGAAVVSNIGVWMQNAAVAWLMTGLSPDPLAVALVQVATALPVFLFALPARALSDVVDGRRLLVIGQALAAVLVAAFAIMVALGRVTPVMLLAFTFLAGTAAALIAPAWQLMMAQLVPLRHMQAAIGLDTVGFMFSRAIGPVLAGIVMVAWGMAAPFWLAVVSLLAVSAALVWWRPNDDRTRHLSAERFGAALRAGWRHVRQNPQLGATLKHAAVFVIFASAYWALLPLVVRHQVIGGPMLYGMLVGTIGVGAIVGGAALAPLKRRLELDRLAAGSAVGTAFALLLFALARGPLTAFGASFIAGVSWIGMLATCNVSAQVALPGWTRGRGLAICGSVMFGALAFGSLFWGQIAAMIGLPVTHLIAAAGLLLATPLLWRWKLQNVADKDPVPSLHWLAPALPQDLKSDPGPVLVTVEYRVPPENREVFLTTIFKLAEIRRRDGAFDWGLFEDAAREGRFVETFLLDSWLENLRQHERVINAGKSLQDAINRFQIGGAPRVTHLIAVEPDIRRF